MTTSYNQIAGQRVERLAGLRDEIFAGAMTLPALDLDVPAAGPCVPSVISCTRSQRSLRGWSCMQ